MGYADIQSHPVRYLALGIGLIILGAAALISAATATAMSMTLMGGVLTIAGVAQLVHASGRDRSLKESTSRIPVLTGALYAAVGILFLIRPPLSMSVFGIVLAFAFLGMGGFRIWSAVTVHFSKRGWVALNGFITLALGLLIMARWPAMELWFLGLLIGIELMVSGVTLMGLAVGPSRAESPTET